MTFCGNCGTSISDGHSFCASCGQPAASPSCSGSSSMTPATASAPGYARTLPAPSTPTAGISSNVAGALSYILGPVSAIPFLLIDPYRKDRLVRFHALQSILFFAVWMIGGISWNMVWSLLGSATGGFLALIAVPFSMLIFLASFMYWLFVMYKAFANERYEIPYIGPLAAKHAG